MRGEGEKDALHHVKGLDEVVGGDDKAEDAADGHEGVGGGELEGMGVGRGT